MVEARMTRDGARDIRDTCGGGQWGVEMCRDQATSWHVSHVWWMDTCPGPGVITLSTARGDRKYIYISPGIMISGSMVMMIAASSTVQWQYLSRRFHDVGVSSPYFEDIVSKMWEHFFNYLHFSWIVWLLVTEPSFSSAMALMGICVLWTALVHSPQRPKNPRSAASPTAVHRAVHAALQQQISRVVFQIQGLFILRTIFTRINIFGNILQGN